MPHYMLATPWPVPFSLQCTLDWHSVSARGQKAWKRGNLLKCWVLNFGQLFLHVLTFQNPTFTFFSLLILSLFNTLMIGTQLPPGGRRHGRGGSIKFLAPPPKATFSHVFTFPNPTLLLLEFIYFPFHILMWYKYLDHPRITGSISQIDCVPRKIATARFDFATMPFAIMKQDMFRGMLLRSIKHVASCHVCVLDTIYTMWRHGFKAFISRGSSNGYDWTHQKKRE